MLDQVLYEYVANTEDADVCFRLACEYYKLDQTASAITFFLRAAEKTEDPDLAYECLIHIGECFDKQGNRNEHVNCMYKHAITVCPDRPEAYFMLANFRNWETQYQDGYLYCKLALEKSLREKPFRLKSKYQGKWGLVYEMMVASWWWGKGQEFRDLLQDLKNDYWKDMDPYHRADVEKKLMTFGAADAENCRREYKKENHSKLRRKFPDSEKIECNYSQGYQDMFVLMMTDGKKEGTFIEIGGGDPYWCNNTVLLERNYGWKGVSIEIQKELSLKYRTERSAHQVNGDALTQNYVDLAESHLGTTVIDYLQLDIEPAWRTLQMLKMLPLDRLQFRVITYEHDHYVDCTFTAREESRKYLISKGYKLIANDISVDGKSTWEDWWVKPELIDPQIIEEMLADNTPIKKVDEYMLNVETKTTQHFATPSLGLAKKKIAHVVDDFYANPDAVRKLALSEEYHIGGLGRGYIGNRTFKQFLFPGVKEAFEEILGKKITKWEEHGMNGRFQYCWSGQPRVYHCDSQQWGGMIYLTPNAPFECGTTLYANKKTRARSTRDAGYGRDWVETGGDVHLDGTPFEKVDVLGNVYNRLVLFDAQCIHAASEYFGSVKEDCRLWQMFFFDT